MMNKTGTAALKCIASSMNALLVLPSLFVLLSLPVLLSLFALPANAQPTARAKVDLRCEAVAMGPTLDCVVQLATQDGKPLNGAQVTLGATMPSMPMAHRVKPVAAATTGQPGQYRGTLELEMSGVWALQVDVAGPLRDRAVVRLQAEECPEGQKRCLQRPPGKP